MGRFNYVLWDLKSYFKQNRHLAELDAAITALQTYLSSPNSDTSSAFKAAITKAEVAASKFPDEYLKKSYQQVLEDIRGFPYVGPSLALTIRETLTEGALTPTDMLASLQKLRKDLNQFITHVNAVADGLDELSAEYELLHEDELELGIHLPQESVGYRLDELIKEISHIDSLFQALNELMGRTNESPEIRTLSTTWYQIFLELDGQQIAAIVFAIERIVALYKTNLEIKQLKRNAEDKKLDDVAELLGKKIDEKLKAGVAEIASQIREKYQNNNDEGRVNEIETKLRIELFHLAKRINEGASCEVRVGLPLKPSEPKLVEGDEEGNKVKQDNYTKAIAEYEDKKIVADSLKLSAQSLSQQMHNLDNSVLLTDYEKLSGKNDGNSEGVNK